MLQKRIKPKATKLNLGAGACWKPLEGWCVSDHRKGWLKVQQAWDLPYADKSFEVVFCSHMIEHVPSAKAEKVFYEINRVLKPGGVLRLLTPDLRKLAEAYVHNDREKMALYRMEDGSSVSDALGLGHAMVNFIISPGYDNYIIDHEFRGVTAAYGHMFCYDMEMMQGLLTRYGFTDIARMDIDESRISEHRLLRAKEHDADKHHSLVVECIKEKDATFDPKRLLLQSSPFDMNVIGKKESVLTRSTMRIVGTAEAILYRTAKLLLKDLPKSLLQRQSLDRF